jgi:hypothetical protein
MKRNNTFVSPARQTLLEHAHAKLDENEVHGPLSWFNPTRALFTPHPAGGVASTSDGKL